MCKVVLIVNGNPRSGKTTFEKIVMANRLSYIYSSIEPVKEIYERYFGWGKTKTEEDRLFLSNMKDFLIVETQIIDEALENKYNQFMDSDTEIFMIDIREIKEIEKYKKKFNAKTVFVRKPGVETLTSNKSDAQVGNYDYDYLIENDGDLIDLEDITISFIEQLESDIQPKLYFQNGDGDRRFIKVVLTAEDVSQTIADFIEKGNFKSYYTRLWINDNGEATLDVGSHTEFFVVTDALKIYSDKYMR